MQVQNQSYGYVIAEDRNDYPEHAHLKDTAISVEVNINIESQPTTKCYYKAPNDKQKPSIVPH